MDSWKGLPGFRVWVPDSDGFVFPRASQGRGPRGDCADPSGGPVIIPAKQAAGAGLSHKLAQNLEAWSGWYPQAWTLLPSTCSLGVQRAQIALSPSQKHVHWEAGFGSVRVGASLVHSPLTEGCGVPGTLKGNGGALQPGQKNSHPWLLPLSV